MRWKKWLWIGFAALCAFAVAIGYLRRPEDELAGVNSLHPVVQRAPEYLKPPGSHLYFREQSPAVLRLLPGRRLGTESTQGIDSSTVTTDLELPSGRRASLTEAHSNYEGDSCVLVVYDDSRPWYTRAWLTLKHRLGLH
jgi:hypothetical protein